MNAIGMLSRQPWVERLGWTLLHFLWEGLAIAFLYAVVRGFMARSSSPNSRYLLACAALAALLTAPLVTWSVLQPAGPAREPVYRIRRVPSAEPSRVVAVAALPNSVRASVSSVRPAQFLSWVVMIWLTGATALWVRLVGGWTVAARMRSMLVRPAPPEWRVIFGKLGERIGVSQPVRLLVSGLVQVPIVVGWLRPVVLVPVGSLEGLPFEHLEALLLHELAHIRRHDYLINILQSITEALLFYHPAVWWISGHIRSERELCCDDAAVSVSGDAVTYARALAQLESYRPAHRIAANGGSLSGRIARLLGQPREASRPSLGPGVVAVATLLGAAAFGLFGQSAAHPGFASVSIKQNTSNWREPAQHRMDVHPETGGRLTTHNAPLMLLIQMAYAAHDSIHSLPLLASQVVGGPAWIDSPGYDIDAKPEHPSDRNHMWLMLQTLLSDHFKLILHRETRELPVYDLEVAQSGLKLPPAKETGCFSLNPEAPMPPRREPGKTDCGYVAGPLGRMSSALELEGSKVRIPDLAAKLAMILGRPVLDRTGFTGDFDLKLSFTANDALLGLPGSGGPGDPGGTRLPSDPNRPNLFAALQEQLGLKLVPAKAPVEVLVIDHVEQPAAN